MTARTTTEIELEKDKVTSESASFVSNLKKDLETAKAQKLTDDHQKKLELEIDRAQAMYDGVLDRLEVELTEAREAEIRAQAEKQSEIKSRSSKTKEKLKSELKQAWLNADGDPDVFEEMFPQLYAAEMTKRAVKEQDKSNQGQQGVINKTF
jgi:hypothetical protein